MLGLVSKVLRKLRKVEGTWLRNHYASSVFERQSEWDILCILDGCRFDTFRKVNWLAGTTQSRISLGSCTPEWTQAEVPKFAKNIVYVSANPYVSEYYFSEEWQRQQPFHHLEEIWDAGWDDTLKTVPPKPVVSAAEKMLKKYPDKKLVLHFMQPHHPFIGKKGIQEKTGWQSTRAGALGQPEPRFAENIYGLLKQGTVSYSEVITAYEDNLALVLREIELFSQALPNKKRLVITADHGNCFGEYGLFAHPEATYVRELIEVPWFSLETVA